MAKLSHFDENNNAIMVDVGGKEVTRRQAVARGSISMSRPCYDAVRAGTLGKGDVLGVARIAGIMAVKQTASLIPLCHPIPVEKAAVEFVLNHESCEIEAHCIVNTTGVTGVEMEALTGATVALLTVYDMCKAVDKGMEIRRVHLLEKTGGKSGAYRREDDRE